MRRLVARTWPIALVVALGLVALEAAARPGGGQGYSGGGGGGGGGGFGGGGGSSGGGDGGLILYLLIRLVFEVPQVGIPLLVIAVIAYFYHVHAQQRRESDSTWDSAPTVHAGPRRRGELAAIRGLDPEFSAVLFGDFVFALYARAHGARGDRAAMEALAPYVAADTRAALMNRSPAGVPIRGVVIGSMTVEAVRLPQQPDGMVEVELQFESNYAAALPEGEKGYYVQEVWRLRRSAAARTRAPEAVTALGCPSCGAPFQRSDAGRCSACGREVEGGRFDWELCHVRLLSQKSRPPPLTHHAEEVGTDDRTRFAPDVQRAHAALIADDPGAAPELLDQRARAIFAAMNEGWTALDLRRVRPFVSDALFNYLQYWIDAYRAQGLRNVIEKASVERVAIVKVERDRHFDAVTIRIWASGLDYTVQSQGGRRVSGSNRHPRRYSEYWTLIRGAGVRGAPRDPATCPNCGAGLDRVSMAGNCEYCGAHLTRGEFDWVLSKIEQDEAYAG